MENLPKTPYPLFSLDSKETEGLGWKDKVRCPPPSFLCTVVPCQRSSAGAADAKSMGLIPGPAQCGPPSLALYPDACQENFSPWAQVRAGRECLPACFFSFLFYISMSSHSSAITLKRETSFRLHPFIHIFLLSAARLPVEEVCSNQGLQK